MGFREDEAGGFFKFLVREIVEIVSLDPSRGLNGFDGEITTKIGDKMVGFVGERSVFFDEKTVHGREDVRLPEGGSRARGMGDWSQLPGLANWMILL